MGSFEEMAVLSAGIVLFAFGLQFHQYRLIKDGKAVNPWWYRVIFLLGVVGGAVMVIIEFQRTMDLLSALLKNNGNDRVKSIAYIVCAVIAFVVCFKIGGYLASLGIRKKVDASFDADDLCQNILKDANAGADEILLFCDRFEGRRSYSFDVDGYNHAAFSETGCKEFASYIQRKSETKYEKTINRGIAGPSGPRLNSNSANDGTHYKFSHISLKKKA